MQVNPFEPEIDWFTRDKEISSLSAAPEPKRRFMPSKWEEKKYTPDTCLPNVTLSAFCYMLRYLPVENWHHAELSPAWKPTWTLASSKLELKINS